MPGVSLFREHNVASRDQVIDLCAAVHNLVGGPPALVAIDQEGGQLQTLSGIVTDFPGNMAVAATGDPELAGQVGYAMGLELRALGVTVNYAPVCDLLTNPTNHGLSIRSFGDVPEVAAVAAAGVIEGLQRAGVAATAKHFPGKGGAKVDTHFAQAVIDRSRAEFDAYELVPFRAAIAAGVQLMMTSHAIVPALSPDDPRPATLNRAVLTTLLRGELGFGGVTITDALDMAAVGVGDQASAHEALDAIRAGADLLLTTPFMDPDELTDGLRRAQSEAPLHHEVVSESHARVARLRRWLAAFPVPDVGVVGCADHAELSDQVARRSITEVARHLDRRPADPDCVVLQPAAINLTPADTTVDNTSSVAARLRDLGLRPRELCVPHSPSTTDIAAAVEAADGAEAIIVVTAAATEPSQVELAERVGRAAARTTVIVARNPLDLSYLEGVDPARLLCSYGLTSSSVAALASVLTGSHEPDGQLPVDLPAQPSPAPDAGDKCPRQGSTSGRVD